MFFQRQPHLRFIPRRPTIRDAVGELNAPPTIIEIQPRGFVVGIERAQRRQWFNTINDAFVVAIKFGERKRVAQVSHYRFVCQRAIDIDVANVEKSQNVVRDRAVLREPYIIDVPFGFQCDEGVDDWCF